MMEKVMGVWRGKQKEEVIAVPPEGEVRGFLGLRVRHGLRSRWERRCCTVHDNKLYVCAQRDPRRGHVLDLAHLSLFKVSRKPLVRPTHFHLAPTRNGSRLCLRVDTRKEEEFWLPALFLTPAKAVRKRSSIPHHLFASTPPYLVYPAISLSQPHHTLSTEEETPEAESPEEESPEAECPKAEGLVPEWLYSEEESGKESGPCYDDTTLQEESSLNETFVVNPEPFEELSTNYHSFREELGGTEGTYRPSWDEMIFLQQPDLFFYKEPVGLWEDYDVAPPPPPTTEQMDTSWDRVQPTLMEELAAAVERRGISQL